MRISPFLWVISNYGHVSSFTWLREYRIDLCVLEQKMDRIAYGFAWFNDCSS